MVDNIIDELISKGKLNSVVDDFSLNIGETLLDLMGIYKRHFGDDIPNYYFLKELLEKLVLNHNDFNVRYSDEPDQQRKEFMLEIVSTRLLEEGNKWLQSKGFAVPVK